MRISACPKCGAKPSPTDTVCLDCGQDLIAAQQDIVEQAKAAARPTAGPASPAAAVANPAAAGMVLPGESAEEKRLRVFDKQEADKLRAQRPAMAVIIVLALGATIGMYAVAMSFLKQAGGWAEVKQLSVAAFKAVGINPFEDPRIVFVITAALALAGLLCIVGEVRRLFGVNSAIGAVQRGETPNVVHLSGFTQIGLLIGAFFAPPIGLILGVLFKFSKDEDTRNIGSLMIYASLLSAAILIVNWIWSLASTTLPGRTAPTKGGGGEATSALFRLIA